MTKCPSQFKYEKTVKTLFGVVGILLFSYLFIFASTIKNTVERQRAERGMKDLLVEVSNLEFSYLQAKSGLSTDLAREKGFVDVEKVIIVKESEKGLTLKK